MKNFAQHCHREAPPFSSCAVISACLTITANAQSRIEWEVYNRFRLYADADGPPALADRTESIESLLSVFGKQNDIHAVYPQLMTFMNAHPRLYKETLYESNSHRYQTRYLLPNFLTIRARFTDAAGSGKCIWRLGTKGVAEDDCGSAVFVPIALDPITFAATAALSATTSDGERAEVSIAVRDRFIVGLRRLLRSRRRQSRSAGRSYRPAASLSPRPPARMVGAICSWIPTHAFVD